MSRWILREKPASSLVAQASNTLSHSSVVSQESMKIAFLIAALNGLDITSCNIGNAYLNAPCREHIWFVAGPECGVRGLMGSPMQTSTGFMASDLARLGEQCSPRSSEVASILDQHVLTLTFIFGRTSARAIHIMNTFLSMPTMYSLLVMHPKTYWSGCNLKSKKRLPASHDIPWRRYIASAAQWWKHVLEHGKSKVR